MTTSIVPLMSGMLVSGYAVAALFFLKFWRATRDALFARFAAAFVLLAVQRIALYAASADGDTTWMYGLRLAAFVLILWAIIAKNRSAATGVRPVA